MKIRNPWVIKLFGFLAYWLITLWAATLHQRFLMWGGEQHPVSARRKRFIYTFWHESILFPTQFRTRIHVLISQHTDGELIAQACRHMQAGTIRGSSTRGGTEALLKLVHVSHSSHLLVTPDGPRGPRRRVQPGVIFLASKTGLPIVPCGVGYERCWRFRSWDRFALPCPWSKVIGIAGRAIHVPPRLSRKELDYYLNLVEQQMLELTVAAERLAGKARPRPTLPEANPIPLRVSA